MPTWPCPLAQGIISIIQYNDNASHNNDNKDNNNNNALRALGLYGLGV